MSEKREKLNKVIVNAVDEELKRIFGETTTFVIYGYLKSKLSLKREKIPEKIGLFSQGLEKLLGSGAYVLEKTILTNLYSSFGFNFEEKKGYPFVDDVTEVKNRLLTKNSNFS